tara:strand:+ start:131 stop:589 length:459 start_codon:yes stop_codon:yes gene_type:complete
LTLFGIDDYTPSEITPQIYIGVEYRLNGKIRLEELGFTHSVSLQAEFDSAELGLGLAHHCYLPTNDQHAPSINHLYEGVAFIDHAVENGGKVYVHCAAGVGRSPTLVAAYFIHQGMTVGDALVRIQEASPVIDPSSEQVRQLNLFEAAQKEF